MPLIKNVPWAGPQKPVPKVFARIAKKTVASKIRQKFASVPPSTREVRFAETAEIENKTVVKSAASIRRENLPPRPKSKIKTRSARPGLQFLWRISYAASRLPRGF